MPHIEFDEQTTRAIQAQAAAHGVTEAEYVKSLMPHEPNEMRQQQLSPDELDKELEELALELPTLPADFSRADIYSDHD